jgi:hypothetical protein
MRRAMDSVSNSDSEDYFFDETRNPTGTTNKLTNVCDLIASYFILYCFYQYSFYFGEPFARKLNLEDCVSFFQHIFVDILSLLIPLSKSLVFNHSIKEEFGLEFEKIQIRLIFCLMLISMSLISESNFESIPSTPTCRFEETFSEFFSLSILPAFSEESLSVPFYNY